MWVLVVDKKQLRVCIKNEREAHVYTSQYNTVVNVNADSDLKADAVRWI